MKAGKLIPLLFFIVTAAYTQHPSFLYKRKISNVAQEGWYDLSIPDSMFSRLSRSGNDIRIYAINASDTTEVPYLLKIHEDQVKEEDVALPILNKSVKDGKLFFTCRTNGNTVNYLDLQFVQENFNAFVNIEGSSDQKEWFEIIKNQRILSIHNGSVQYKSTQVRFPASDYAFLRISISSDVQLELKQVSFKNYTVKAGRINQYATTLTTSHDTKLKQSTIQIALNQMVPVNQIKISVQNEMDYYRPFTLEYASDSSKTQTGWVVFYEPLCSGHLTSIKENTFTFALRRVKKMRLIIHNQDNAPLNVTGISAASPRMSLITKLHPSEYFLFYGNSNVMAPDYDLKHFKDKIPDSLQTVGVRGEQIIPLTNTPPSEPLFSSKPWLWGVMGIVIGVMAFFTLRMMKEKEQ